MEDTYEVTVRFRVRAEDKWEADRKVKETIWQGFPNPTGVLDFEVDTKVVYI